VYSDPPASWWLPVPLPGQSTGKTVENPIGVTGFLKSDFMQPYRSLAVVVVVVVAAADGGSP
jgi:hypothetical protein